MHRWRTSVRTGWREGEKGGRVAYGVKKEGEGGGTRRWERLAIWWYIRKRMGERKIGVK